jgi:hypothetical protein
MRNRTRSGRKEWDDRWKIDKRKDGRKQIAICKSIRTDYFINVISRWRN